MKTIFALLFISIMVFSIWEDNIGTGILLSFALGYCYHCICRLFGGNKP